MKKVICKECEKEFMARRKDAKFCNDTCRSKNWQRHNMNITTAAKSTPKLRGVANQNQKESLLSGLPDIDELNAPINEFDEIQKEIVMREKEKATLCMQKNQLKEQLNMIVNRGRDIDITSTLIGVTGMSIGSRNRNSTDSLIKMILGGGIGYLAGNTYKAVFKSSIDRRKEKEVAEIEKLAKVISDKQTFITRQISRLKMQQLGLKPSSVLIQEKLDKRVASVGSIDGTHVKTKDNKRLTITKQVKTNVMDNKKIISVNALRNMDYSELPFQNNWKDLLGLPSVNFHCAITGMAGEGKSTFAIQFAHYLAQNFGEVLYISGEEGFSKTMKDKMITNNIESEHLFMADINTYQEMVKEIKPNHYNFIFVDSLDNMRIGVQDLKELRKIYDESALITISQSTKDGKLRGSYEIVHDADIYVKVSNGVAETNKNRFKEKGMEFQIF